jgi:hypothetical protein
VVSALEKPGHHVTHCWYRPTKDGRARYVANILKSDAVLGAEGHLSEEHAGVANKREAVCEE